MANDELLPELIVFKDQWQGDSWAGREFIITRNSVVKDLTNATITATFLPDNRRTMETQVLEVGNGITITNGPAGTFELDEIPVVNWNAGTYTYDIEIIYADGEVKTPVRGTWKIVQDKTNNS